MGKENVLRFVAGAVLIATSIFIPVIPLFAGLTLSGILASAGLGLTIGALAGLGGLESDQNQKLGNPISASAPIFLIYGQARVGMPIIEFRSHPTDKDIVYLVGTVAIGSQGGDGIEDVLKIFFDDTAAVTDPVVTGALSSTGVHSRFTGTLEYAVHLGTDAQTHDVELNTRFPSQWPTTSDGRGIAYVVLKLTYDESDYATGLPGVTLEVKGQKLFDPRTSSTVWSANPALAIRDYLTSTKYGWGIPTSEIDDGSIQDAANYCDEVINTTAYNGPRFTCNGVIDTSQDRQRILAELLTSCRGDLVHQGGKYRLIIRRPTSPTSFELSEDNIVGDWEFVRAGSQVPNSITAAFIDPAFQYQVREITWPEAGQANGFLTADNNIASHARIDLPYTNNIHIAQQLGMVTVRETREDVTIAVTAKESALILQAGDVVPLTHSTPGFTDKLFWVVALSILPDATVRLVLREYDVGAYTLDTQNTDPTVPGTDLPNPFTVAAPTNFTLASGAANTLTTQDGLKVPRIKATWTAAAEPFLSHYEMQFKRTVDTPWIALPNVLKTETETFVTPVANGVAYDVRIRSVNTLGVASAFVSASHTVSTSATAVILRTPEVSEVVTRSGTTATLTLTIADPTLAITAIQFNKREGDGALTGYVSTWDSSSGTIGVNTALSRSENVSVPDGKDSEIRWRVIYTDAAGNSRTIENTVHLANLRTITKVLRVPFSEMIPAVDTDTWNVTGSAIRPNATLNTSNFMGSMVLPIGVTITNVSARLFRNTSSDTAFVLFVRGDSSGGAGSTLATLTHSTTGWQTISSGISELVDSGDSYFFNVELQSNSAAADSAFAWLEVTYSVPSYAASY